MSIDNRSRALRDLVRKLLSSSQFDSASRLCGEIETPAIRLDLSIEIGAHLISAGELERGLSELAKAESIAKNVEDVQDRSWGLHLLASALVKGGTLDRARTVTDIIEDPYHRTSALLKIAAAYVETGRRENALALLFDIPHLIESSSVRDWEKAEVLCRTGALLHRLDQATAASTLFEKAIVFARQGESSVDLQESMDSSSVLREIAHNLNQIGETGLAGETTS